MNWVWLPFFPMETILLLAGTGLALAAAAYVRTRSRGRGMATTLFLLRSGAVLLIAIGLAGPAHLPPPPPGTADPVLEIWLDTSASMATTDMDGLSRIDFARRHWLAPDFLERLAEPNTLLAFGFDEQARALSLTPADVAAVAANGPATRIVRSLVRAIADRSSHTDSDRAILLLSDGIDSYRDHPSAIIDAARARQIPVHTVPLGGPRLEQDLALTARPLQDVLIAGEPGLIQAQIFQTNAGRQPLTLHIDDGSEVRAIDLQFRGEPYLMVEIPVRHEHPGTYAYNLHIDPLPREIELRNNHQTVYLEVSPQRFRVLVVEGEPGWETKYIAQALRHDPRIELLQVSQLSVTRREVLATRIEAPEAIFPETMEALGAFDAIVLGRAPHRVAGEAWLELLHPFVHDQGGGLLWARGPPEFIGLPMGYATTLTQLSPLLNPDITHPEVRFQPTAAGRMHPAFLWGDLGDPAEVTAQLPPVSRAYAGRPRAGAEVLASFGAIGHAPALLTMPYGSGRLMLFAGDGLWSWRILPPDAEVFDGLYDLFWTSLIRQLVSSGDLHPGQDIGLLLSEVNVRAGGSLTLAAFCRLGVPTDHLSCVLTHPDGRRETLALRELNTNRTRFESEITPTAEGQYLVTLENTGVSAARVERRFNVFGVDTERLHTSARPEWMSLLARETGGAFLDPREPEQLLPLLARQRAAREVPVEPVLIWNRTRFMLLTIGLLGLEWILRKSKGWL